MEIIVMILFLISGGAQNGSNGFTAVGLHAASGSTVNNGSNLPQPLPIQSIKPIQAVQPQIHSTGIPIQQVSIGNVNFLLKVSQLYDTQKFLFLMVIFNNDQQCEKQNQKIQRFSSHKLNGFYGHFNFNWYEII